MPTNEMLTEEAITVWFHRFFSVCKKCSSLLHNGNCYQRDDTKSQLHSYCKNCYIEIQKARNSQVVKSPKQYYYLINKKRAVFFDTKAEKEKYLADRKSMAKFSSCKDGYSSLVGCTESRNGNSDLLCDQCGGLLRRNNHGELECTVCNLISDLPILELERNINFDKQPYRKDPYQSNSGMTFGSRDPSWSASSYYNFEIYYKDSDEGAFDVYYSKAYSKRLKKDNDRK